MPADYTTRYGATQPVDLETLAEVAEDLLEELREEEFDEPDDEHTQVSIANDRWSVTAQVSGLVSLDRLDDLAEVVAQGRVKTPAMHLRDLPDDRLIAIWRAVVAQDDAELLAFGWQSINALPPFERDFYRETSSEDEE